jgi:hypothetical protein
VVAFAKYPPIAAKGIRWNGCATKIDPPLNEHPQYTVLESLSASLLIKE